MIRTNTDVGRRGRWSGGVRKKRRRTKGKGNPGGNKGWSRKCEFRMRKRRRDKGSEFCRSRSLRRKGGRNQRKKYEEGW